jgi:hypothetical protein
LPILVIVMVGLLGLNVSRADPPSSMEYHVKAAFLYKFCMYVDWPAGAFKDEDSPVVLGIAGPKSLAEEVEETTRGRNVNGRPIRVRHVDGGSIEGLHLLFISESAQIPMRRALSRTAGHPLVLVTESEEGLDAGGVINFVIRDGRVRFDVDLDAAKQRDLRLSAQLLKVARIVRGAP